jgi:hypothetical protein
MGLVPRAAFPSAALQLVEAIRDYQRKLSSRPEPERGTHAWYMRHNGRPFDVHSVFASHFEDPFGMWPLAPANWHKPRPTLYVSIRVKDRSRLLMTVRSTEDVEVSWYGSYVTRPGDFCRGFSPTDVLDIDLGPGFCWSFDDQMWRSESGPYSQADERHLCVLAVQAKLHQLSLFFDCRVNIRLVEFGDEHLVDWRDLSEGTTRASSEFRLDSRQWTPPRLREMLDNSHLSAEALYKFASDYLSKVDDSKRATVYSQFLANSHSGGVSNADAAELIALANPAHRATLWLKALVSDPQFAKTPKEHHWWLSSFAREANLSESEAVLWILNHHPDTFDTYTPAIRHIKAILESRDVGRLSTKARLHLDSSLATAIHSHEQYATGMHAVRGLERTAGHYNFNNFDELVDWTRKHAPATHRAVLDLAEVAARAASAAKTAANEKRKATVKARSTQ